MTFKPLLLGAIFALAACQATEPPTPETDTAKSYAPSPLLAKTLPELAKDISEGRITSEALTRAYLDRIARVDDAGPELNAVLTINPDAIADAKALDAAKAKGETLGPLHGLPVLLKDNIESADPMATTAGAIALTDNITNRDAPLVAELRSAGAVILGKTNLSQWANFRSENSMSGWSALGGQTRNPHSLDRNPCGSSSGSGAAMAASLAAGAVGTETNGSIICPSNINGIVGFKPTVGLVSGERIIPISPSQDTAGPMTKSVRGAAMMLGAMDGVDVDYTAALTTDALSGQRIGVMRFAEGSHADIIDAFNAALKTLEVAGAELVEIESFDNTADNYGRDSYALLQYEFKDSLNAYLATTPDTVKTRTLSELIAFNKDTPREMVLFDQSIFDKSEARGLLTEAAYLDGKAAVQKATRTDGIDKLLKDHNVVALVAPSGPLPGRIDPVNGDVWPDWAGAGYLAAVAGYPNLTVPMGVVRGLPVGISFMGARGDDANILAYGYAYEQQGPQRVDPQYRSTSEDVAELGRAMQPFSEK